LPQQRVRLLALAKVDRLLDRRGDMQRAYLQLRNRPLRDGRRLQLERELRRNARETRAAVRELIADLQLLSGRKVAYQYRLPGWRKSPVFFLAIRWGPFYRPLIRRSYPPPDHIIHAVFPRRPGHPG